MMHSSLRLRQQAWLPQGAPAAPLAASRWPRARRSNQLCLLDPEWRRRHSAALSRAAAIPSAGASSVRSSQQLRGQARRHQHRPRHRRARGQPTAEDEADHERRCGTRDAHHAVGRGTGTAPRRVARRPRPPTTQPAHQGWYHWFWEPLHKKRREPDGGVRLASATAQEWRPMRLLALAVGRRLRGIVLVPNAQSRLPARSEVIREGLDIRPRTSKDFFGLERTESDGALDRKLQLRNRSPCGSYSGSSRTVAARDSPRISMSNVAPSRASAVGT
jgi:hypothetical protein